MVARKDWPGVQLVEVMPEPLLLGSTQAAGCIMEIAPIARIEHGHIGWEEPMKTPGQILADGRATPLVKLLDLIQNEGTSLVVSIDTSLLLCRQARAALPDVSDIVQTAAV